MHINKKIPDLKINKNIFKERDLKSEFIDNCYEDNRFSKDEEEDPQLYN